MNKTVTASPLTWQEEIRSLASDFLISRTIVTRIIRAVEALDVSDSLTAYRMAWKRLKPYM